MSFDTETGLHLPASDHQLDQRLTLLDELGLDRPNAEWDAFAAELAGEAARLDGDGRVPYAMVNVFTREQLFVGLHNPTESDMPKVGRVMPVDHGYCPEVVDRRKALVLPDVCAHPRFASNPVVDQIGIRTYAGAPLLHEPTGIVLGTVCVVGTAALPRDTGKDSLALITHRRDALMKLIDQRTHPRPQ